MLKGMTDKIHPDNADDDFYKKIVKEGAACVNNSGKTYFPSGKYCSKKRLKRASKLGRVVPQEDGLFEGFSQTYIPTAHTHHVSSVTPLRVLRQNIKGWRLPDGGAYVGKGSRWANPFKDRKGLKPLAAVTMFREHLIAGNLKFGVDDVRMFLSGRDLADWTPLDQPSHVNILLEVANDPDN